YRCQPGRLWISFSLLILLLVTLQVVEKLHDPSQEKMCKPKTDIVFLKVHKSASSTVMNILFRFGEMHNLTFAFPVGGGFQLYYPHHFLAKFVQGFSPQSPRRFNILCHHMRFLQPEVQKVVPRSAVYFSILRNPVQLMESSFVYYKGASAFSRVRSLAEFLSQPYRYYSPTSGDRHYARNLMTFDFGFNPDGDSSPERVQLMLNAIEASFDFVLISEYFDESMVLLKEMLCWDLDSVVSFPLNSRDSSTKSPLPDDVVEKLKAWNRLDWEIYTHFNRTFWERIERRIGRERLRREVAALRARQAELARTCLQGTGSVAPKDIKDSSLRPLQHGGARILGYNLKQGLAGSWSAPAAAGDAGAAVQHTKKKKKKEVPYLCDQRQLVCLSTALTATGTSHTLSRDRSHRNGLWDQPYFSRPALLLESKAEPANQLG
uniref:Galactose-3-O-sulfotransferase 2 n=1 Tax=Malurus cyaneus samueli TaxID=2593467 RepID=A0A8C5T383_9PASS